MVDMSLVRNGDGVLLTFKDGPTTVSLPLTLVQAAALIDRLQSRLTEIAAEMDG